MQKKMCITAAAIAVLLTVCGSSAQVRKDSLSLTRPPIRITRGADRHAGERNVKNEAFGVGEHLVFDIAYGVIKAGTAVMSIPETLDVKGRSCYRIVTTARSNSFFSTFYKVRDTVETYIDVRGIFPWKFKKHIREGNYRSKRYVDYQQEKNLAVMNGRDSLYVPDFIQGVLSAFYYVRIFDLEPGSHFDITAYGDGKMYPLRVLVHKREKVTVPAGTFNCIMVEPVLQSEGIFNQQGRLHIWLTDDREKIPVLMKSKILVGSIDCRLRNYRRKK